MHFSNRATQSLIVLCLLITPSLHQAEAAGFAISEQSVVGIGRASAGSAAAVDDASTIFFNPAGLTYLEKTEFIAGLHYVAPEAQFSGTSTFASSMPISGENSGDVITNAYIPNMFYAQKINDRVFTGIGITVPFGLSSEYDDDWKGRYLAIESHLKTINFNPSLAYKVNSKLSLGAGINLQYIDLELTKAVDFGSVCSSIPIPSCASPTNVDLDGKVKLTGDDWSWGYNLGLIYEITEQTRFGMSYRSKISHTLEGQGQFSFPSSSLEAGLSPTFNDGDIYGSVSLPESASFALHHQFNNRWAVMGDISWTRWNRFQELKINSDNSVFLNSTKQENWENALRYGIGTEFTPSGKWSYRAGITYEETPIPSSQYRTPRIPDTERIWLAFGTSYQLQENLQIDAAYAHIFSDPVEINDTEGNYALNGEYEGSVDIFSLQMKWYID